MKQLPVSLQTSDTDSLIAEIASDSGPGGAHTREAARAKVDTILVGNLAHQLAQLSADLNQAQLIFGERLSELSGELVRTREQMSRSSEVASQQASALVKWTRAIVIVTAIYVLIAGGQLLATLFGSPCKNSSSVSGSPQETSATKAN